MAKDRIPALALANMLRHAFFTGAGYKKDEKIKQSDLDRFTAFGWDEGIPNFSQIEIAIKQYNESRTAHVSERASQQSKSNQE